MARLSFSVDRILQSHHHRPRIIASRRDRTALNSGGESESPGTSPPTSPNYPFFMYPPHALIVGPTAGFATLPLPFSNLQTGLWSDPRLASPVGGCYSRRQGGASPPGIVASPQTKTRPLEGDDKDPDTSSSGHESDDPEDELIGDETDEFEKNSPGFDDNRAQTKKYKKKRRTTFTNCQLQELESKFLEQKYLTKLDRIILARALGLTEKHIKTWYQNRRTKWKKECTDATWSKEREAAAAAMYNQYVQIKAFKTSPPDSAAQNSTTDVS